MPWRVVPPASHKVSRASWYSGTQPSFSAFRLQDFYFLRYSFPTVSTRPGTIYVGPSTPKKFPLQVWAPPISLAATLGISFDYSSSGYLDVSVHRVPSLITQGDGALPPPGFPIRISTDLCLLATPRGFSQLTASFIGSWRLGILHMPLLA